MVNKIKNILRKWREKSHLRKMANVYEKLSRIAQKNNIVIQIVQDYSVRLTPQFLSFSPLQGEGRIMRGNRTGRSIYTETIRAMVNNMAIPRELLATPDECSLEGDPTSQISEQKPEQTILRKIETAVLELEI